MNTCRFTRTVTCALAVLLGIATQAFAKPNVVLIVCDDLNDFVTGMDGHPQAHTPNIEGVVLYRGQALVTRAVPVEGAAGPLEVQRGVRYVRRVLGRVQLQVARLIP